MLRSAQITRFLSGFLLLVFGLSITPKRMLHDAFAKHIDNKAGKHNGKPFQIVNAGYNCDNDNLVAESSFVCDQQVLSFPVFTSFSPYVPGSIAFSSAATMYSCLRGPPAIV